MRDLLILLSYRSLEVTKETSWSRARRAKVLYILQLDRQRLPQLQQRSNNFYRIRPQDFDHNGFQPTQGHGLIAHKFVSESHDFELTSMLVLLTDQYR